MTADTVSANRTAKPSLKGRLEAWALRHMDAFFRVQRTVAPILVASYGGKRYALVSRFDDVQEVLSRPNVFGVPYAPKFAVIMDGGKRSGFLVDG